MRDSWAVVCDFDGTATTEDLGDLVAIEFGGYATWREAEDRYQAGAISFSQLIATIFQPVKATRQEIAAFARRIAVFRPGLERFVAACRAADRPFVFASAGLDVYIESVLERLPAELREHVQLRCNRALCSSSGLAVHFHVMEGGCGRCGFCKGAVVDELRRRGYRVATLGDGSADRCAAERADLVFARGRLPHYCDELGIPYTRFETFDEVIERFPR